MNNAFFQRLYRFITFFLGEKAFDGNDHVAFFHKPGAYFLVMPDIEAAEDSFFNKVNVAGYVACFKQEFLFCEGALAEHTRQVFPEGRAEFVDRVQVR